MQNYEEDEIQKQARLIAMLNKRIELDREQHKSETRQLKALEQPGKFYMVMQRALQENPALLELWSDFLTYLQICEPDFEAKVKSFKFQDYEFKDYGSTTK